MLERKVPGQLNRKKRGTLLNPSGLEIPSSPYGSGGAPQPAWKHDFIAVPSLPYGSTYARNSTAQYVDSTGTIQTAAIDEPRFGYDPTTLVSRGYLSEKSVVNDCTSCRDFSGWLSSNDLAVQTDYMTAPNGAMEADLIEDDSTTTAAHGRRKTVTMTADADYCASYFVKAVNTSYCNIAFVDNATASNGVRAFFNFSTELLENVAAIGTGTLYASGVEKFPDGWYRIWVSGKIDAVTTSARLQGYLANSGSVSAYDAAVNGGKQMAVWGAQAEIGRKPTSIIYSDGSKTTRGADSLTLEGAAFDRFFKQEEGTLLAISYVDWPGNYNIYRTIVTIGRNPTVAQTVYIHHARDADGRKLIGINASTAQASYGPAGSSSQEVKGCISYQLNNVDQAFNGTATTTDTVATMPTALTTMYIGWSGTAGLELDGYVQYIAYWNKKLPAEPTRIRTL